MAIERYWLLSCPRCQWERELDTQSAQQLLRSQGLLRRRNDVDAAELQELLVAVSGRVACEACKECGIEIGEAEDFGDDPGEVRCQHCGRVIEPQRVAALPHIKLCLDCQQAAESGQRGNLAEDYCPRCGQVMQMSRRAFSGLAGYQLRCPNPHCRAGG